MSDIEERPGLRTVDRSHSWGGAAITVTAGPHGASISVSQEKAVDSYNQEFTCVMDLSWQEAEALALFLIRSTDPAEGG